MDEQQTCDSDSGRPCARHWYLWDVALAVAIAMGCPYFLPLFGYVDGLRGTTSLNGVLFVCMFWPAVGVFLIILASRAIRTWPRRIPSKRKLRLLRLALVGGFTVLFVLPFTPLRLPGPPGFCEGFRRYVRSHLDVCDVQAWLDTLDPNLYAGEFFDLSGRHGDATDRPAVVDWPEGIFRLAPRHVQLTTTGTGRLKMRLTWGGGLTGEWGVEIGPVDMAIPKSVPPRKIDLGGQVLWDEGEYRLPLAPGAYVWHELQ